MDFTFSKEHEMARKLFADFTENEVKPLAIETDETETFPRETVTKMQKLGFLGIPIPKEYGGQGCDPLTYVMCVEELAKACATTSVIVSAHTSLCCDPILTYGTEEQKQKFLKPLASGELLGAFALTEPGAGTDAQGAQTKAVLDGDEWVLNGSKCFITNGKEADIYIVIAVTDVVEDKRGRKKKLFSAFIVPKTAPGFLFGTKEKKMGIRGSSTYELIFQDCRIPKDNLLGARGKGFGIAMHKLDGVYTLCTKGAMDVLLARSVMVMTGDGPRPITEEDKQKIADTNLHLSENGLRVLAFAIKQYPDATECPGITLKDENDYTFVGLISMIDPPREESKKAVADAKRGGIRTVMITGDHKVTATAIAKEIGIFQEGDIAVSGVELDKMNDEELDKKLEHISVYARVSPEHKIRIVDAWQKKGKIVSMTGDGVNDAPALKKADIGVAMGITGTEVSKDAASMILTDDNFATIVKAVTNGRNVYANIKNAIKFLLSGNMSAILSVLYTSLFGLAVPFQPVHLLFINLLTDSLPAIAIGMEPAREDLLNQKPRNPKESIMTKDFMLTLLVQGALIGVFVMTAYHIGLSEGGAALASTMAFATLTLARLFHGFNCRADASIFKLGLRSNIYSILAFVAGLVLLNAVLFIPAFHGLFLVADLTLIDIGWIYLLAFIPTVLIQIYKVIKERVK